MSMQLDELKAYIEEHIAKAERRFDSSHRSTYYACVGSISAYNQIMTKIKEIERNGQNTKNES